MALGTLDYLITLSMRLAEALSEAWNDRFFLLLISHDVFIEMKPVEPWGRKDSLNDDALHHGEHSDGEAEEVLFECQGGGSDRDTTILHKDILHDAGADDDIQEEEVVEETLEYVVLFNTKLSCIDLVEYLHEDKSVEDYSKMLCLLSCEEAASYRVDNIEG